MELGEKGGTPPSPALDSLPQNNHSVTVNNANLNVKVNIASLETGEVPQDLELGQRVTPLSLLQRVREEAGVVVALEQGNVGEGTKFPLGAGLQGQRSFFVPPMGPPAPVFRDFDCWKCSQKQRYQPGLTVYQVCRECDALSHFTEFNCWRCDSLKFGVVTRERSDGV